jgi:hypothetical protein
MVAQRNCQTADPRRGACSAPRCYVHVYLDGALIDNGERASMRTDFSRMDVNQLAGVEYYADGASVPIQYSTTGADSGVSAPLVAGTVGSASRCLPSQPMQPLYWPRLPSPTWLSY